ncbi:neither inactivation nor afterpotential protein G [Anopheles aquasalis]|uniref:neither inactivation nor afterpotential protein G n=1 Tax=Anopheles aquasalis TaxID=42839 RepID=UPI00215ACFA1|nr:neither inactivation nor afterpotential protein G [Anopheles aquasalis]
MGCLGKLVFTSLLVATVCCSLLLLLWVWLGVELIPNEIRNPRIIDGQSFDYIIVGAGTAGCVLANRLSRNPNVTVLLIEAGGTFGAASIVPLMSTAMQGTKYDWAFRTTPQKYSSHGLDDNQQLLPRGKGLGGSGQINFMLHFTGTRSDFDRWERLGALDWSWAAMKPYLDQLEGGTETQSAGAMEPECIQNLPPDELYEQPYPSIMAESSEKSGTISFCQHTTTGAQGVPEKDGLYITSVDQEESLLARVFTDAPVELGPEYVFKPARYTIRNGIRWSSYHAHLRAAFGRPNLTILTSTTVTKVLFDETKHIRGLLLHGGGKDTAGASPPVMVHATREIILSAGALQTPQLLKLSGIGPKLELQRHGIAVLHDSPQVGQNYFDHLNLPLFVTINATASVTVDKVLSIDSITQYLREGRGVLATTAIAGIGGPVGGRHGIILFGMGSVDEQALRHVSNMRQETFRAFFPFYRNASQEGFLFLSTCHQPRSRGAIFLRDQHVSSVPFFNPNYLKDRSDIECMMDAIRLAAKTVETQAFQSIGARLHWPRVKRCSNFGPPETGAPSDRYLECILRTTALTGHHPGGTAAIGLHSESVVDNQLRVNGVKGLRVVDASVFPSPVSGTPNSIVIAVAERASDLILRAVY